MRGKNSSHLLVIYGGKMSKNIDNLEIKIEPEIQKLGYELEYIEYVKEGNLQIVRVVIDNSLGITTKDCEKISKTIESIIDKNVKYNEGYILEISSPGLERSLKNTRLYKKYIGNKVLIKLYKKFNGSKELVGILKDVNDESIVILIDKKDIKIKIKDIVYGNTVYDFEGEN